MEFGTAIQTGIGRSEMSRITLDSTVAEQLRKLKGPVELLDSVGNALGTFMPVNEKERPAEVKPPFTLDELKRFENEPGGRTLDEILADLEKRA
jgi:hypothetical protein